MCVCLCYGKIVAVDKLEQPFCLKTWVDQGYKLMNFVVNTVRQLSPTVTP